MMHQSCILLESKLMPDAISAGGQQEAAHHAVPEGSRRQHTMHDTPTQHRGELQAEGRLGLGSR